MLITDFGVFKLLGQMKLAEIKGDVPPNTVHSWCLISGKLKRALTIGMTTKRISALGN